MINGTVRNYCVYCLPLAYIILISHTINITSWIDVSVSFNTLHVRVWPTSGSYPNILSVKKNPVNYGYWRQFIPKIGNQSSQTRDLKLTILATLDAHYKSSWDRLNPLTRLEFPLEVVPTSMARTIDGIYHCHSHQAYITRIKGGKQLHELLIQVVQNWVGRGISVPMQSRTNAT